MALLLETLGMNLFPCFFSAFFIYIYMTLFVYFLLCWVFVATCGLSLAEASGACSAMVHGLLILVASLVEELKTLGMQASVTVDMGSRR